MSDGLGRVCDGSARLFAFGVLALLVTYLIGVPFLLWVVSPLAPDLAVGALVFLQIGPKSDRCFNEQSLVYDPRRERADRVFIAEPPENVVQQYLSGREVEFEIDRVEVFHKRIPGEAYVSASIRGPDGSEERRQFLLLSTHFSYVTADLPSGERQVCNTAYQDWQLLRQTQMQQ